MTMKSGTFGTDSRRDGNRLNFCSVQFGRGILLFPVQLQNVCMSRKFSAELRAEYTESANELF